MIGLPLDGRIDSPTKKRVAIGGGAATVLLILLLTTTNFLGYARILFTSVDSNVCPVQPLIAPKSYTLDNSTAWEIVNDPHYRTESVKRLSGAVQIDTQIYDNQPDVPDSPETWAKFQKFHDYLEKTFPLVYKHLDIEKVNTYGLVFHWKGTSKNLKPLLLMAHQDTVPIQSDTIDDWTYPPLSGHYDGKFVYGRGSSDCKNTLIAILESFELLLQKGYVPKRSVLAGFGFDEESSGPHGAAHIAKYLEKTYGKDSLYAIIDEGPGLTLDPLTDSIVGIAATSEKGYVDVRVELKVKGGHSSVPPDHTSIGILGELAYRIEQDQFSPVFTPKNPMMSYLQCMAVNDPKKKIGKLTKKAIFAAAHNKLANSKVVQALSKSSLTKYLIKTSQAINLIRGGEKSNALPEVTSLVVNHRISLESSVSDVKQHFTSRVIELAKDHHLSVESFGEVVYDPKNSLGLLKVTTYGVPLEPAPRSPSDDQVWKYLSGVTRHIFEDLAFPNISYPVVLAPALMPANTDTRYYWNLSRNIYRYSPALMDMLEANIHSVDEKLLFDAHLQLHSFFYEYIQAVDTEKADN